MSSLPYIQLYIADYLADTQHLTTEEHGAYLLLIFNYWQRGKSFKARDEHVLNKCLASVAHMSEQNFNLIKNVLSEFFEVRENEWIHHRIEQDLERVSEMSEKRRNAGKASAEARKIKSKTVKKKAKSTHDQHVLNKCLTSVEQVLIYKEKDKEKEYISKESNTLASITKEKSVSRFVKPSLLAISEYFAEIGSNPNEHTQRFFDHYETVGWCVGKAPMKCWKAAIRKWVDRDKKFKQTSNQPKKFNIYEHQREEQRKNLELIAQQERTYNHGQNKLVDSRQEDWQDADGSLVGPF
jgi:uncharacterized protein YdaU (DUF1376 family)